MDDIFIDKIQQKFHDCRMYFDENIAKIEGWLDYAAAAFTQLLMEEQDNLKIPGNVLELGIYHGRYLAHLYKCAQTQNRTVVGIDAFLGSENLAESFKYITNNVRNVCGETDRLILDCKNTLDLKRKELISYCGKNFIFISIDAGHERKHLINDLNLTVDLLEEGGILALDDAFNPIVPGVNEGINAFMQKRRMLNLLKIKRNNLAPFAYLGNKIFVTTCGFHKKYLKLSYDVAFSLEKNYGFAQETCKAIRGRREIDFVTELWGYEILPFK